MPDVKKATLTEVRNFFAADGGRVLTMAELKEMKTDPTGWGQLLAGIGDGTLTY
jgi:hypothetical protein